MTATNPLILVVEDDAEMNELLRELLAIHGLDTMPAYSGREALEKDLQHKPNGILLDVMLPEIDGFETCQQIRQQSGRNIPIIMLTALDSSDCRERGIAAGADAYFIKPFDPDEVVDTLRSLMDLT